jgi:hypothetical protein
MSRICDCSQIQLRRAKNHYCSATARSLFFFLGAFFLVNLRTPAWRKGLRAPWAPGGDLIHTLCGQASEVEVNHFQEGEIG